MTGTTNCLLIESDLFLPEVARRHRVHPETVGRWVRDGLVVNGRRVRLEAVKLGRWRTSEAALARFAAALTAAEGGATEPVTRTRPPAPGDVGDEDRP
jgi:hypothetical protein